MRNIALTAALAATLAAGPALAGKAYPVGKDSFHIVGQDLTTPQGRAEGLRLVERSAARLCDGIQPRVDFDACTSDAVKIVATSAQGQMIRLAMQERDGVQTAAK